MRHAKFAVDIKRQRVFLENYFCVVPNSEVGGFFAVIRLVIYRLQFNGVFAVWIIINISGVEIRLYTELEKRSAVSVRINHNAEILCVIAVESAVFPKRISHCVDVGVIFIVCHPYARLRFGVVSFVNVFAVLFHYIVIFSCVPNRLAEIGIIDCFVF